jgi:hypothetical protein
VTAAAAAATAAAEAAPPFMAQMKTVRIRAGFLEMSSQQ